MRFHLGICHLLVSQGSEFMAVACDSKYTNLSILVAKTSTVMGQLENA